MSDDLIVQSITNTASIAFQQIEDFLPDTSVQLPSFMVPSDKSADEALIRSSQRQALASLFTEEPIRLQKGGIADDWRKN